MTVSTERDFRSPDALNVSVRLDFAFHSFACALRPAASEKRTRAAIASAQTRARPSRRGLSCVDSKFVLM